MKNCLHCGKEFQPKDVRSNRPRNYCSIECGRHARYSQVSLVCVQCHQTFQRKAYMADWSQERGPFCGFDCYGQWQMENATGPKNPNYSSESVARGCVNYLSARSDALLRDNYKCRLCGSHHRLHVHHVGDPDDHALDNLMTLCASCHRKQHPLPRARDGKWISPRNMER